MEKRKEFNIYEFLKQNWIRFIISIVYAVGVFLAYMFLNNGWNSLSYYGSGLFIAGFTLILIGGLSLVNQFGQFNIFSFIFNNKRIDGRKETLAEYGERKELQRSKKSIPFLPYMIIGVLVTIASVIIYIIYNSQISNIVV